MKKIIVPVDFSLISNNAAMYGAHLAAYLNTNLVLFHVINPPVMYTEIPLSDSGTEFITNEKETLDNLAAYIDETMKGQVNIETIVKSGSPTFELIQLTNRLKPYALIMGTKSGGSLHRYFFGSTTLAAINDCNTPVWVIPPGFTFKRPRKIALASDMKHVAETTPDLAIKQLISDFEAEMEIIHVTETFESGEMVLEEQETIGHIFENQHPGIKVLHSMFTDETLLHYSAEKNFDLMLVVPKKHNWFESLLGHEHTKNLIAHSRIPVVVLKPIK